MGRVPITVTVDEEVLEKFKKLCEENDIKVSTKVLSFDGLYSVGVTL